MEELLRIRVPIVITLLIYTLASGTGMMLMKSGLGYTHSNSGPLDLSTLLNWKLLSGCLLYIIGFLLWLVLLRQMDLMVAYPVAVGSLLIVTTVGSYYILGEHLNIGRIFGLISILFGIVLLFSNRN